MNETNNFRGEVKIFFLFFCESRHEVRQSRGFVNTHNNSSMATGFDKKIFPLDG